MLIEACLELVFSFPYVLTVVAYITVEHVDDVCRLTCEFVSNGEGFFGLHASEGTALNKVVGAYSARLVAFIASWLTICGSREDRGHEDRPEVFGVPFPQDRGVRHR